MAFSPERVLPTIMLETAKLIAFVATANPSNARRFYETALGLRVVSEDAFALTLDANGTMLRIQKVESLKPHPFTTLGWQVSDIELAVDELRKNQVTLETYSGLEQDERGIWRSPSGTRVAWFRDPDGNTLSLTQFPEAAPGP